MLSLAEVLVLLPVLILALILVLLLMLLLVALVLELTVLFPAYPPRDAAVVVIVVVVIVVVVGGGGGVVVEGCAIFFFLFLCFFCSLPRPIRVSWFSVGVLPLFLRLVFGGDDDDDDGGIRLRCSLHESLGPRPSGRLKCIMANVVFRFSVRRS